jgi:hypothetical protein
MVGEGFKCPNTKILVVADRPTATTTENRPVEITEAKKAEILRNIRYLLIRCSAV